MDEGIKIILTNWIYSILSKLINKYKYYCHVSLISKIHVLNSNDFWESDLGRITL